MRWSRYRRVNFHWPPSPLSKDLQYWVKKKTQSECTFYNTVDVFEHYSVIGVVVLPQQAHVFVQKKKHPMRVCIDAVCDVSSSNSDR